MTQLQTYWLTKYALTTGIREVTAKSSSERYIFPTGYWSGYKFGSEIFLSRQEAIAAAEQMRERRISALKKTLARLEKLSFKEPS